MTDHTFQTTHLNYLKVQVRRAENLYLNQTDTKKVEYSLEVGDNFL